MDSTDTETKSERQKPPLLLQAFLAITSIGSVVYGLHPHGVSELEMLIAGLNFFALFAMLVRDSWRWMVVFALLLTSAQSLLDFHPGNWMQWLWKVFLVVWPLIYIPLLIRDGWREWMK